MLHPVLWPEAPPSWVCIPASSGTCFKGETELNKLGQEWRVRTQEALALLRLDEETEQRNCWVPGKERVAHMKEHRGEERLGSAGQSGQSGESGHAKEDKVMCGLWGKEGQGKGWS